MEDSFSFFFGVWKMLEQADFALRLTEYIILLLTAMHAVPLH